MRPERRALTLSDHPGQLPEGVAALLTAGLAEHICLGRPWFETVAAHAMPDGARAWFALATDAAGPFGLLASATRPGGMAGAEHALHHALGAAARHARPGPRGGARPPPRGPPPRPGCDAARRTGGGIAIARPVQRRAACRRPRGAALRPFRQLARAGGGPRTGRPIVAARPGALRETVRRKLARFARGAGVCRFEVVAEPDRGRCRHRRLRGGLCQELEGTRSPIRRFNAALMRALAPGGTCCGSGCSGGGASADRRPVLGRCSTGVRSCSSWPTTRRIKPLSPGTVLTAMMLRRLLDEEHVSRDRFRPRRRSLQAALDQPAPDADRAARRRPAASQRALPLSPPTRSAAPAGGGADGRYLVTGGCGFIGSHLSDALLARGHRGPGARRPLHRKARQPAAGGPSCRRATSPTRAAVRARSTGVDGCFHLAAIASVERGIADWLGTPRRQSHRHHHRVRTRPAPPASRSRSSMPPLPRSMAMRPPCRSTRTEPPRPLSAYGADKLGCELHARVASQVHRRADRRACASSTSTARARTRARPIPA